MELWELVARESIRDLVARYNANGDAGRFAHVLELFAPDAVMEIVGDRAYHGHDEILSVFTGAQDRVTSGAGVGHMRHFTATHQIDLVDPSHAEGRCYFGVLTPIGLDHWGRYVDRYVGDGERWLFEARVVSVDGYAPDSRFVRPTG